MKHQSKLLTLTLACALASGSVAAQDSASVRMAQAEEQDDAPRQQDANPEGEPRSDGEKRPEGAREKEPRGGEPGEARGGKRDSKANEGDASEPKAKTSPTAADKKENAKERRQDDATDDRTPPKQTQQKDDADKKSKDAPARKVEPDAKPEPAAKPKPAANDDNRREAPAKEIPAGDQPDRQEKPERKQAPDSQAAPAPATPPQAPAKQQDSAPEQKPKPAPEAAAAPEAAPAVKLEQLKENRKERTEDGGKRVIIEEPGRRAIVKEGGRTIIRHDETERFRRLSKDTRVERRDGLNISVTVRPGGIQIFTEQDADGRALRRYRRGQDGRDVILFDNRDYYARNRGGSFIGAVIELPPPRYSLPRDEYILDYDGASDDDVYEALSAPPVEELERGYSLQEVRYSSSLRDRMRRVDLDAITFEFGSWDVSADQYPKLERVARAMSRVIESNPAEMFLIEGHTDAVGSDDDNLSLSDRRAETVAIILTEEFNVPPENLTTQGYGEQYLKVQSEEAERENRRVAVRRVTPLLSKSN